MIETKEVLEIQLQQYQNDQEINEKALEKTRSLLERADLRRKKEPKEKRRWDDTLENLENSLRDIKRKLTISKSNVVTIGRKLENWDESSEFSELDSPESEIHVDTPPVDVKVEIDDSSSDSIEESLSKKQMIEAVFQHILSVPIFMVSKLPHEEISIVKACLHSGIIKNMAQAQAEELKKRIHIYENQNDSSISGKKDIITTEIKSNPVLHAALEKCITQNFTQLTLEELVAIQQFYNVFTVQESLSGDDQKMKDILTKSIEAINNYIVDFPKP